MLFSSLSHYKFDIKQRAYNFIKNIKKHELFWLPRNPNHSRNDLCIQLDAFANLSTLICPYAADSEIGNAPRRKLSNWASGASQILHQARVPADDSFPVRRPTRKRISKNPNRKVKKWFTNQGESKDPAPAEVKQEHPLQHPKALCSVPEVQRTSGTCSWKTFKLVGR